MFGLQATVSYADESSIKLPIYGQPQAYRHRQLRVYQLVGATRTTPREDHLPWKKLRRAVQQCGHNTAFFYTCGRQTMPLWSTSLQDDDKHDSCRLLVKYDYGDDIRCGHYYLFYFIDFRRIHSQKLGRREHLDRQVSGFLQAARANCCFRPERSDIDNCMLPPRIQQPSSSTSVMTPTAGCKASTLKRSSTTPLDMKLHHASSLKRRRFKRSSSRTTPCGWSAVAVPFAFVASLASRLLRDESLLDEADTPARLHEPPAKLHAILRLMDHYLGRREPFNRQVHQFVRLLATSSKPPPHQSASDKSMLPL
ncbi:unnamed protein product, partial [Mesorhabditis spiculigera]